MKIYTRTGDEGETSFLNGARVSKSAPRVHAYGDIDELNACVGVARTEAAHPAVQSALDEIQQDLFSLGAILADPTGQLKSEKASLGAADVERLEKHIDGFDSELPALKHFILPGGSKCAALLHQARAVCRRAERAIVAVASREAVSPVALAYMNRLSDLLFVMARLENQHGNIEEKVW